MYGVSIQRHGHSKLSFCFTVVLSFLRPEILEELVTLVLDPPDENKEDCLKYK